MVNVRWVERKSAVLSSSSLACLAHVPTINLTSGCAHGCLYCYARGYSVHPGPNTVVIYKNVLTQVKDELARKRIRPTAVYFSPSSDIFQPVTEVLEMTHSLFEFLFSEGIGVAFLTKGRIPERSLVLLLKHANKVRAQLGIITTDENTRAVFEPNSATTEVRLAQMARMVSAGIATEARVIPVLTGVTDASESFDELFGAIAAAGVRHAAVSALFLRPAIMRSLRLGIADRENLELLLNPYRNSKRLPVRAEHSSVIALPRTTREELYGRARRIASKYSISLSICGCMNPDVAAGTCNIAGKWPDNGTQPGLFEWRQHHHEG